MSFGKNPEQLSRIVPFGGNLSQRARHLTHSRQQSRSSGGGAPYWMETFKVPQDHARFGRLIPGAYAQEISYDDKTTQTVTFEYVMFKEHFMGGHVNRGGVCSSGPLFGNRHLRQPCLGCDIFWEDVEARKAKKAAGDRTKGPNRISTRDMFAFTWFDYGLWYHAPRYDDRNQPVTDQSGNQRYDWVMGQDNDARYANCERKYGHLIAWPMGETYKETLLSANDYIMQDCTNCGQRGSIQFVSKNCSQCGTVIYDATTSLTPETRTNLDSNPFQCQCGNYNFLTEVINCSCGNGRRATIFDVDLQITAVGSKGQQTFLQILNRSEPRLIQVADQSVLANIKPLDLIKKFAPTPLDKQREYWGSAVQAPPQQQQQLPYGQPMMGMPPQAPPAQQYGQPMMAPPMQPPMQPGFAPPLQQVLNPPQLPTAVVPQAPPAPQLQPMQPMGAPPMIPTAPPAMSPPPMPGFGGGVMPVPGLQPAPGFGRR